MSISDPFFSGNQSSWMSFPPVRARHRTVVELQFQPLSPDGILVYAAQRLSARAGEWVRDVYTHDQIVFIHEQHIDCVYSVSVRKKENRKSKMT